MVRDIQLLLAVIWTLVRIRPSRAREDQYIPLSRDGKPAPKLPPKAPGGHELFAWVKACGGWSSESLQVKSSGAIGRGLFAGRGVKDGELLVSLPVNCTINSFTAPRDSNELSKVEAQILKDEKASRKILVAAYLLRHMQKPTKRFKPYLEDLVKQAGPTIEGLPTFWKPEDGKELHGTFVSELLKSMLRATSDDWDILTKALPNFAKQHTLQEYQLAYAFAGSRTFTVSHEELGSFPALCPLIDIGNHGMPEPAEVLNDSNGPTFSKEASHTRVEVVSNADGKFGKDTGFHVQLSAQRAHAKGEQLFLNYGLAHNAHNMVQYGFVVPWVHNMTCLSTVTIHIEVDELPDRSNSQEWKPWLRKVAGDIVTFQVGRCGGGFFPLLDFLRLWCSRAEAKDLEEKCGVEGLSSEKGLELSRWRIDTSCPLATPEAELEALLFLGDMARKRIKEMAGPSSVEEEEKVLETKRLTARQRAIRVVRRDEKAVLRQLDHDVAEAVESVRAAGSASDWRTHLSASRTADGPASQKGTVYSSKHDRKDEL